MALVAESGWDIGTCAAPMRSLEARSDRSEVKIARAQDGRALYFSRAGIPYQRDEKPTAADLLGGAHLLHLGVYAYSRAALTRWVALDPSPLELLEQLEQLRPLEAGMSIGVAIVDDATSEGVDTPADVVRMEKRLRELTEPHAVAG